MAATSLGRPESDEYSGAFAKYVALVPEQRIVDLLVRQWTDAAALLEPLTETVANTVHHPYTWTIKEVVGHLADCEPVFAYRALRAARGDTTPLAGFEENDYARHAHHATYPHAELLAELALIRQSSIALFSHLDEEAWLHRVTAAGVSLSVRALAYVIVGHARHHLAILRRRLGQN